MQQYIMTFIYALWDFVMFILSKYFKWIAIFFYWKVRAGKVNDPHVCCR
jgi:hypothetical protein